MTNRTDLPQTIDVDVATHGRLPNDAAEYARSKVADLGRFTHRPLAHARVRLTRHSDPAVERPIVAQANVDMDGRLVRAQADGATAHEAIDQLEARLRRNIARAADHWEARRGQRPRPPEWRHQSEPTQRQNYFPRPAAERRIVRRKSFTLKPCTVDVAALEMDLLDYDFHLFTEERTGIATVLYRGGQTGYRLAQVAPTSADELAPFALPATISPQPVPCLTVGEAKERLGLLDLPFLFYVDAAEGRASVLYHRYDGHYGLITPAGEESAVRAPSETGEQS
ncbi:ribosome hibernation promotion factor [Mycolicibacterium stellerae]|uniref:ribosome hibernation promotion factor n=1 Tax=Mycolicibacterium stellerae TaxID=2358193 RepID=UPI000F0B0048|nr:HPF/RaiA family ribosome-associated protein [Mycolicibacterium stellerae]